MNSIDVSHPVCARPTLGLLEDTQLQHLPIVRSFDPHPKSPVAVLAPAAAEFNENGRILLKFAQQPPPATELPSPEPRLPNLWSPVRPGTVRKLSVCWIRGSTRIKPTKTAERLFFI